MGQNAAIVARCLCCGLARQRTRHRRARIIAMIPMDKLSSEERALIEAK
jgi:hypothetical protein